MRQIATKERGKGMLYCTFCKPKKVHAIYRSQWNNFDETHIQFCCESHLTQLHDGPKPSYKSSKQEDTGRITEADYQTWMQL